MIRLVFNTQQLQHLHGLLSAMQLERIISNYAIGGGIAAKYWSNPPVTKDIDIFVKLVNYDGIDYMRPVYDLVVDNGGKWVGQHLVYHKMHLEFLPAHDLTSEAVDNAVVVTYDDIALRIMSPDYIAAIAYFVGRKKDAQRIEHMQSKGLLTDTFYYIVKKWQHK